MRQCAVIIPTTCLTERASLLRRAVSSVDTKQFELVVVANGPRIDENLLHELQGLGASIHRMKEGNVSVARLKGVASSKAPFFSFLDDDDELLPGGLAQRVALFRPGVACVVTNGYLREEGVDMPLVPPDIAKSINTDLVGSFLRSNWFASPASTFDRNKFSLSLLDTSLRFFELTRLFFRMIEQGLVIRYDDVMTYRVYRDHPYSASKSVEYARAYPEFLRNEVLTLKLSPNVHQALRRKYATALNTLSLQELQAGHRRSAWVAHLRCLMEGGWQYLPYTRKLLM